MGNLPIKAIAEEFTKEPFYLIQQNGNNKRYVVSLKNKMSIRILLAGFINQSEDLVEVKIRNVENEKRPMEYSGIVNKSKLHSLMTEHESVIFHHGYHDFMIRNPYTGDYVAFDEHGLVFIYSLEDYSDTLTNLQAAYRENEKLIFEFRHMHYSLPEGDKKLQKLINDLELK